MRLYRPRRRPAYIPVVSMADIAFLLIIFFMLTTTFIRESGLHVKLPGAHSAEELPQQRDVNVTVSRSGEIRVETKVVPLEGLPQALREQMRALHTDSVLIRADRKVLYEQLIQVMDIAKTLGARVSLAVEKLPEPPVPIPPQEEPPHATPDAGPR